MSIFDTATAACPACGEESEFEAVMSVNADRRPDLRQEILDGTFQASACPKCGTQVRLPPEFTYLELRRRHWIAVHPLTSRQDWPGHEQAALEAFDEAFGKDAPAAAQELAAGLVPRVVFGWAALQEKLLLAELGLDDAILELLKITLLHDVEGLTIVADAELRLNGGDGETLGFDWLRAETGEVLNGFVVPRKAYDAIAADAGPWGELRTRIVGTAFVDLQRALVGGEGDNAA
jgi:hypothetical protein